jgi:hypothetical protein
LENCDEIEVFWMILIYNIFKMINISKMAEKFPHYILKFLGINQNHFFI